jgi:S-adenosylmethionine synthetase
MFGYATNETGDYMPLALMLAHEICGKLTETRKNGNLPYLKPDGKAQVTVEYNEDGDRIKRIEAVVVSAQHSDDASMAQLRADVRNYVIGSVIPQNLMDGDTKIYINPTGRFVAGGPDADCGLTGRKIIVDTYGGACPHGGGAFSGKDPTKVDRSAAYAARWIAKNIVAARLAEKCTVALSYAIGIAEPVAVDIDTHGTGACKDEILSGAVRDVFDLTPQGIISALNLRRPIYAATAVSGHFGRSEFTWERTDKAAELLAAVLRIR